MTVIRTTKSASDIKQIVKDLPRIIAGQAKDPHRLHGTFWGAIALSMFNSIKNAFEFKSEGGTDELGITWDDLDPKTKAYSRPAIQGDLTPKQKYANSRQGTLGLLSPSEHKRWKKVFASALHWELQRGMDLGDAKVIAAQMAWTRLKKEGASTKIDVLGSRNLLILRNTERLYRSFFPGKLTRHSYRKYNRDQVYSVSKGKLTVGTAVEYAEDVDKARPLWAANIEPWLNVASQEALEVTANKLRDILR